MGVSATRPATRWAAGFMIALLLLSAFWSSHGLIQPARAQEKDAGKEDAGDDKAENAKTESTTSAKPSNLFTHVLRSAGWFFGPLLLLVSICLVALVVLMSMDLRMSMAIPPAFVDEFTETVNKRRFREAFDLAKNDTSFLGRVLTAGMGRLQYGIEDARDTAYHTVDSIRAGKEQLISYLATIGTLGPMLGLVGTVYGMILSFLELSQPGKTPNPQKLADGISHALVVTLLGVGLAVPAIFCHAFFKNRLTRISMDTSTVADDLLTQMYHNSKKPAPLPNEPRAASASTAVKPVEG